MFIKMQILNQKKKTNKKLYFLFDKRELKYLCGREFDE